MKKPGISNQSTPMPARPTLPETAAPADRQIGPEQPRVNPSRNMSRLEKTPARRLAREKAANREKDLFLAVLSHELRMPLSPVLLLASDGADNQELPPEVRNNFDMICQNIEIEARLIDDILDLS